MDFRNFSPLFSSPPNVIYHIIQFIMELIKSFKNLFQKKEMSTPVEQAEVVLVGCGAPLRGMGWYHAVQMLGGEVPHAKLAHVVEPWFLGAGEW